MDSLLSISIFTLSTSLYARNTRKFVNASRKTTAFLVTYFGRFGNILTNPTKILCEGPLQTLLAATPIPSTTFQFLELPVSRTGVAAAMQSVWAELHATLGFDRVIMVHLGADGSQVDRDTASIKLETRGYNCADFRIPDNDGDQPRNEIIDPSLSSPTGSSTDAFLPSTLDLSSVKSRLHSSHGAQISLSQNAGRYVCNYTLFTTLNHLRNQADTPKFRAAFVHLPTFDMIEESRQRGMLVDIFREMAVL